MADKNDLDSFPKSDKDNDEKEGMPNDYSSEFIQISRRVKLLEESLSNLRKKLLVNEQNDLNRYKKLLSEDKASSSEINELKKEIENMKRVVKEFVGELKSSARKEDVEVLKRYIEMWNPVNFVTEGNVEKLVDDRLESKKLL
jgi:hypothetical protein